MQNPLQVFYYIDVQKNGSKNTGNKLLFNRFIEMNRLIEPIHLNEL